MNFKLIILALISISLQRFIIQDFYNNDQCNGEPFQGAITTPGLCTLVAPNQGMVYRTVDSRSYSASFGCNGDCSSCQNTQTMEYSCSRRSQTRFGLPLPIKPKGFVVESYSVASLCERRVPTMQYYFVDETCQRAGLFANSLTKGARSVKVGWNSQRNGVEIIQYETEDCQGREVAVEFLPSNVCVKPNGPADIRLRIRKSF